MLPGPRLILMVAIAAPLFLAGALFAPLLAVATVYCGLLLVQLSLDLLLLPRRNRIEVTRIVPERIPLNEPTQVQFDVRNRTWRRLRIDLAEDLPARLEAEPASVNVTLGPGESAQVTYRLRAASRGRHALAAIDVRARPAWGLLYRQFRITRPTEVHVFPNLVNLRRYELLLRRGQTAEQGIARLRMIGQGSEFESLRPYAAGDEMSRVDWKATAKRARLIVRNREPERQQHVLVAIDLGRATAGEFQGMSRLDYFINAALMLAGVALRQGDWFSLVAFSDRIESYLPPVRHIRSIERVARALYLLESRLVEADYGAACRFLSLKNRKRSLICLMTDVIDREASGVIIGYMARFARHHLPLAITLADPEMRAAARGPLAACPDAYVRAAAVDVLNAREEALTVMRQRGVGVLDVTPPEVTPGLINRYALIKTSRRL
jgi:uncharacterized protein (DUF58 family)